jgi:HTH-type transcriptional regulator/antitoxin MqsA
MIDMPGWYCNESGESIHTGEDMKISDAALAALIAGNGSRLFI